MVYREENSESKTNWNRTETAKIRHRNTNKVSRRQGKAFLFDSCTLISSPKRILKFPYKPFKPSEKKETEKETREVRWD